MTIDNDFPDTMPWVILAGGTSERFGAPKGLAVLGDKTLLAHVHDRLRAQTDAPIWLNVSDMDSPYIGALDVPSLPDRIAGAGPLAGLHTAMIPAKAQGFHYVGTVSIDTPFLPSDLVARLTLASKPCVAESLGRTHPTVGVWPTDLADRLETGLRAGEAKLMRWADTVLAQCVNFPATAGIDPFFNINRPEDLREAAKIMAQSQY